MSETNATLAIKELIQLTDKEARKEGDNLYGNPTHCHTVRGKWDRDGSVCKSCEAWDKVREVAAQSLEEPSDGK